MGSTGLIVFFVVVGIIGTGVAVLFSVDNIGEKFFSAFSEDKRR